jgi:hypothetical protein
MTMAVHKPGDRWHYALCIRGVSYREAKPVDSRYEFLLVLTFLSVAFLLFPDMVVACARAPKPTVLDAYNDSDVVVIARAISVEKLSDESQKP